jgi:glycosyltransferase involved in cell wall biosynthesis
VRMEKPTVSVIIPSYNVTQFIETTIDSVLSQTRKDFEIIVVNDGCPDSKNLERVLAPYGNQIRYITQSNSGQAKARNTGIEAARGEFVAVLDGDDYWDQQFLESQLAMFAQDPSLDMVSSDAVIFGENVPSGTTMLSLQPFDEPIDIESLLAASCSLCVSTAVMKRSAALDVGGFDPALRRCEDYDMWIRMVLAGKRLGYNKTPLGRRRVHGSSMTVSGPRAQLLAQIEVRAKIIYMFNLPQRLREIAYQRDQQTYAEIALFEGTRLLRIGKVKAAVPELKKATAVYPNWKVDLAIALASIAPSLTSGFSRAWHRIVLWRATRSARQHRLDATAT